MNDDVAAAVRSLEATRSALAGALVRPPSPVGPHRDGFAGTASAAGPLNAFWTALSDAASEHWQRDKLRASWELARPVVEDAVRRQPWTAVAVAGMCGAVAVWIVSTRRRFVVSAMRLWWRTAGTAILASAAFKWYEQYVGERDRAAPPREETEPSVPGD